MGLPADTALRLDAERDSKVHFIAGTPHELGPSLMADMARFRHDIFIKRLGWSLQVEDEMELDQFDRPDTVYVVGLDDYSRVIASARLLCTTGPYLLQSLFPQLTGEQPCPASADVWELSRYAAVESDETAQDRIGPYSSPNAVALLKACIRTARRAGVTRLITVSPVGIERLLRNAGFRSSRAGPPLRVDNGLVVGCWLSVTENAEDLPPAGREAVAAATERFLIHANTIERVASTAHFGR